MPQFFAELTEAQRMCAHGVAAMHISRQQRRYVNLQMPTAAEQAFACMGKPMRLCVKVW